MKEPVPLLLALTEVGDQGWRLQVTSPWAVWSWTPVGWAATVLTGESRHQGERRGMGCADSGAQFALDGPAQGQRRRNGKRDRKFTQAEAAGGLGTAVVWQAAVG